jgi:hypothetical protein
MSRLTDNQLIVLSRATQREDGIATPPPNMRGAALAKVGQSLIERKFMRLIRTKPDMPIWRTDHENKSFSLAITSAGRKAIGTEGKFADQPAAPAEIAVAGNKPSVIAVTAKKDGYESLAASHFGVDRATSRGAESDRNRIGASLPGSRAGTKQAHLIEMLSRAKGAAFDEIVEAMRWLPHTTRAALTGLRHRGFDIRRYRADGKTFYRILGPEAVGQIRPEPEGAVDVA